MNVLSANINPILTYDVAKPKVRPRLYHTVEIKVFGSKPPPPDLFKCLHFFGTSGLLSKRESFASLCFSI